VLEPLKGTQAAETPSGSTVLAFRGGDVNWQDNCPLSVPNELWTDPDTLVLFFSSDAQECSNPVLAGRCVGATPFWQTIIAIPPELDRNGPIDLHDLRINAYSMPRDMDGTLDCGGGGRFGPILNGTLTLTGAGSPSLSVKLDGVTRLGSQIPDGMYTPRVCGVLPPGSPPPRPRTRSTARINLSDPAIAAAYIVEASTGGASCAPPADPLPNGTVEILSSDAGGLTFKVYQSSSDNRAPGWWLAFDGL